MIKHIYRILLVIAFLWLFAGMLYASGRGYPRIANLWGCYASDPDFDKWAKYDLLVMGGANYTAWQKFRTEMKSRNPDIIMLGTAPLMNLGSPKDTPWMKPEWYLKRPDGSMVRWWADMIYTPNLLNDECLNALVEQADIQYGRLLNEGIIDGLMYDSVVGNIAWLGEVDIDGDGQADRSSDLDTAWHEQQNQYFDRVKAAHPGMLILANDVDSGHRPHVNGRLFEGATLLDNVAGGYITPFDAINTLNEWMEQSQQPGITFALASHPIGWQWWRVGKGEQVTTPGEVDRIQRDYHRMRLGLLTTLITDAYYGYDVGTTWYGLPLWYAEYDAHLGNPLGKAREVYRVPPTTILDWTPKYGGHVFRQNNLSRMEEDGFAAEVPDDNSGWNRLISTDPSKITLMPLRKYRVDAYVEIMKKPSQILQFTVRTAKGGWEKHDKGVAIYSGQNKIWHINTTVALDDFDDYAVEWHLLGSGRIKLHRLKITEINNCYIQRDFEGGCAILNPNSMPITARLDVPMRRISDDKAPLFYTEIDNTSDQCKVFGLWEKLGGEDHYYGDSFLKAIKPGETIKWSFTAPASDTYYVFTCNPGDKHYTDAAYFTVEGVPSPPSAMINQRKSDGGWVKLFDLKLEKAQKIEIVLKSSGEGATVGDAIRIESKARYNDGALVRSVNLPPLDGIILLKAK